MRREWSIGNSVGGHKIAWCFLFHCFTCFLLKLPVKGRHPYHGIGLLQELRQALVFLFYYSQTHTHIRVLGVSFLFSFSYFIILSGYAPIFMYCSGTNCCDGRSGNGQICRHEICDLQGRCGLLSLTKLVVQQSPRQRILERQAIGRLI